MCKSLALSWMTVANSLSISTLDVATRPPALPTRPERHSHSAVLSIRKVASAATVAQIHYPAGSAPITLADKKYTTIRFPGAQRAVYRVAQNHSNAFEGQSIYRL